MFYLFTYFTLYNLLNNIKQVAVFPGDNIPPPQFRFGWNWAEFVLILSRLYAM